MHNTMLLVKYRHTLLFDPVATCSGLEITSRLCSHDDLKLKKWQVAASTGEKSSRGKGEVNVAGGSTEAPLGHHSESRTLALRQKSLKKRSRGGIEKRRGKRDQEVGRMSERLVRG